MNFSELLLRQPVNFWIYTFCVIFMMICLTKKYLQMRTLYPTRIIYAFLRLCLLGVFPFLSIIWIGMLYDITIVAVIGLYLAGIICILMHQYACIFLRASPQIRKYPNLHSEISLLQKWAKHSFIFYLFTSSFFLTGTFFLYIILNASR